MIKDKDDWSDPKLWRKFNRRMNLCLCSPTPFFLFTLFYFTIIPAVTILQDLQDFSHSSHLYISNKNKKNYKPNFHLGMHPHFLYSISAKETLRSKMKLGSKMWDNSKNNTTPNMTWRSLKNTEWLGKSAGI